MPIRERSAAGDAGLARLLAEYLQEQARLPFVWGESDCWTFASGWVLRATGIDLAPEIRGTYTCRRTATLQSRGDLAGAVDLRAARAGLERIDPPATLGAVAVVGTGVAACAIRTRRGWALRDERRVFVLPIDATDIRTCWGLR